MYKAELSEKSFVIADDLTRAVMEMMNAVVEKKTMFSPQIRREMANAFFIAHSGVAEHPENTENFFVSASDGYEIPLRKYTPRNLQSDSVILFAHGGGWIQGNLDTHDYLCRKMAGALGVVVVAADYRLAPEFIFPTPLEDLSDVYKWCSRVFPGQNIILAGDSAGGNLCAALCIKSAEEQISPKPSAQVLFYPVLSNDFESESFEAYENAVMSKNALIFCLSCYVGRMCTDPDIMSDALVYPLLQNDMNVFPQTVLVPAQCDVLLDGQISFAEKLSAAGVKADVIKTDGTVHGFMTYGKEFDEEINCVLSEIKKYCK